MEHVILVNEQDLPVGTMEKLAAHQQGLLHRAFSVFIFNAGGELLLQQRAYSKYHSAGLWTNTCCSHPRPGEDTAGAASRRLREEMGLHTPLTYKGSFIYRTPFGNGLTEHEYDHVFTGVGDETPVLHPEEAEAYKWMSLSDIKQQISTQPDLFTSWFRIAIATFF